jgi:hypothetical protein
VTNTMPTIVGQLITFGFKSAVLLPFQMTPVEGALAVAPCRKASYTACDPKG